MAQATMVIRVPFEIKLEHYAPGTSVEEAARLEAGQLEDGAYSIDEFVGDREFTCEVEL